MPRKYACSACLCEYDGNNEHVLSMLDEARNERHTVQFFDANEKIIARLLPAYINAALRTREGIARSGSTGMEMMLFVSGSMNIRSALSRCGVKDRRFIAFSDDKGYLDRLLEKNGIRVLKRYGLAIDINAASDVAMAGLVED